MKLEAAVIQGDGVGPEMMEEAVRVLQDVYKRQELRSFTLEKASATPLCMKQSMQSQARSQLQPTAIQLLMAVPETSALVLACLLYTSCISCCGRGNLCRSKT